MNWFLVVSALLSFQVFSHDKHDWREDYEAYLSVNYEFPLASTKNLIQKKALESRIDINEFNENLKIFSSTSDRRSTENLDSARAFLRSQYEQIGFLVSEQPFGNGKNFIAEKKGTTNPEKVLILSSHIDSVRCAGANDNGTGTIGLLSVAKELSKQNYPYTIRILGFDKEEIGLVGSDAYVATISDKKNIIGNINFEMMGVNQRQDGSFHVIDCQKSHSLHLSQAVRTAISNLALPLTIVKACTDRSDHASFWRHGLPAVVISENFFGGDADPCYHAKCDIVDNRLNFNYMKNILEAVLEATENLISKK
jgi:hypothetical protein